MTLINNIRSLSRFWLLILLPASLILNSCSTFQTPAGEVQSSPATSKPGRITPTPFQPILDTATTLPEEGSLPTETPSIEATSSPTPDIESPTKLIWLPSYLPADMVSLVSLPHDFTQSTSKDSSQVQLMVDGKEPIGQWVYAIVAPYPTITDNVSIGDVKQSWQGISMGPFAGRPLLMNESTFGVFSAWWGAPAPDAVRVIPSVELLETAWQQRPSWGIIPFGALEPGWKVLAVEGQSPLLKEFDPSSYPLIVPFSLQGDSQLINEVRENISGTLTNRDPDLLTTVAVTGVTALVRATAFTMHRNGITYPARDIGQILRDADITHISNEIPFTPDCPFPNPTQEDLRFCSRPEYIELLEEVGTDVVELTGDHFGDWGPEAMRFTLDMYTQRNWIYYGGGYDREDARQPRLIEHHGNRIAFIGCNGKGGGYATASDNQPGAVACDFNWMQSEIARLGEEGYQVIVTFQHFEYYTYYPQPDQVRDFRTLADAGAAVVSGSQAHQPQGMEFYENAYIHYGLGNLFFDQYHFCTDYACDDGFIDLHVFYAGKYLGNELIPIVFEDYARPRPMTAEEKAVILTKVFSASNW